MLLEHWKQLLILFQSNMFLYADLERLKEHKEFLQNELRIAQTLFEQIDDMFYAAQLNPYIDVDKIQRHRAFAENEISNINQRIVLLGSILDKLKAESDAFSNSLSLALEIFNHSSEDMFI